MAEDPSGSLAMNRGNLAQSHAQGTDISKTYVLEKEKMGEGTYGSVCKAKNKFTKKAVAVKSIAKKNVKNLDQFFQEISIMKTLDHPNIIKLFETFEDGKFIYLVMELCVGGELFDRIVEAGNFTERACAMLMRQMFSGICYCHEKGIVHRDLKPENFLFLNSTKESPLKIIDFGLATPAGKDTILHTKAGTPYYVAPQVLAGAYDYKCDVWSLGVIMYILLCGYPPFPGDSDAEILQAVKSGRFEFPDEDWSEISRGAKKMICELLTKDPNKRSDAKQALHNKWLTDQMTKGAKASDKAISNTMMENLRGFRNQSRMKKMALTVIATQVSDDDIERMKAAFHEIDVNGDGMLSVQEMKEGLAKNNINFPGDMEQVLRDIDSDGSGTIDYTEFLAATMDKKLYIKEDVCWSAFRVFDRDGSGKISKEELAAVLGSDDVKDVINAEKIASMINEVDKDGDGEIDFDEFMAMMKSD